VSVLTAREAATARSNAYHLLGTLFLEGVTEPVLAHVRAVDDLNRHLPRALRDEAVQPDPEDLDDLAAAYQDTFGFNVFPFQSTFLDRSARAGGEETERVTDFYLDAAFPVVETAESADHIGVQLNFLGFLSRLETEADREGRERARVFARRFLDEHLLRWLPILTFTLASHAHPIFHAVSELTLEMALDHRQNLEPAQQESSFELPEPPSLLDDPKTGLRDIAEFLLVPAYAGFFLSRSTMQGLSRKERLPAGFGSRKNMLTNMLRSAAHYDGMQDVTEDLIDVGGRIRSHWKDFQQSDLDVCRALAEVWIDRLNQTEKTLRRIQKAHAELVDSAV